MRLKKTIKKKFPISREQGPLVKKGFNLQKIKYPPKEEFKKTKVKIVNFNKNSKKKE